MQDDLFGIAPDAPTPPPEGPDQASGRAATTAPSVETAVEAAPAASRPRRAARAGQRAEIRPVAPSEELLSLAQQLPAQLRMGVSTWSYPGWKDLVWDGDYDPSVLSKNGLSAYSQHPLMRTVSVDRTFWRPLSLEQYARMAQQVPDDFRFLVKCPNVVTDAQVRDEHGKGQTANPAFLSPQLAVQQFVLPAVHGMGSKLGVLVFQLSPLAWQQLQQLDALLHNLSALLHAVRAALHAEGADQVITAVEVRDPELICPALAQVLKDHQSTYCLGLHAKLPGIAQQLPLLRALWPGPLVCRWSLNRIFGPYGYPDAQAKHEPFNEIRSEDVATRAVLARTIAGVTGAGQPAFVTISNDAEGCAPRSIALLAQAVLHGAAA